MGISLDEMNEQLRKSSSSSSSSSSLKSSSSASTAAAPGGTAISPAKPSRPAAMSLDEMNAALAEKAGPGMASWGDVVTSAAKSIPPMLAETIAGAKLGAYEKRRMELAERDPATLRRDNSLEQAIERERGVLREIAKDKEGFAPKGEMDWKRSGTYAAIASSPFMAGAMATGLVGGVPLALATMYGSTKSQKFGELALTDIPLDLREKHAVFQGTVEAATELPFLGPILSKVPGFGKFVKALVGDVGGEIAAQYLQGTSDYVAEKQAEGIEITSDIVLEGLAKQTQEIPTVVVASLLSVGVASGSMVGINAATGRVIEALRDNKKGKATADEVAGAFDELAAQSPTKAAELAERVTDPKLAKYLKDRVAKFEKASEEELAKVGEAAAKRQVAARKKALAEMTPDEAAVKKMFQVEGKKPDSEAMLDELTKGMELEGETKQDETPTVSSGERGTRVAPIWFSPASKAATRGPVKANGQSWMAFFRNSGVKEDELYWTGLDAWLAKQKGPVSRERVMAYLADNQVKLRETLKGGQVDPVIEKKIAEAKTAYQQAKAVHTQKYTEVMESMVARWTEGLRKPLSDTERDGLLRSADKILNRESNYLAARGHVSDEEIAELNRLRDASEEAYTKFRDADLQRYEGQGAPRFDTPRLRQPGGENYRELLIQLPVEEEDFLLDEFIFEMNDKYGTREVPHRGLTDEDIGDWFDNAIPGATVPAWSESDLTPEERARYKELLESRQSGRPAREDYESPHFEEGGIISIVRFTDRVDNEGNRILYIDELQDDLDNEMRQAKKIMEDSRNDELDRKSAKIEYERLKKLLPFRGKSHELALKRMIRWAAENGYKKIAWPKGQVIADRYDLSRVVKQILVRPYSGLSTEGEEAFSVKAFDLTDNTVLRESIQDLNDLIPIIGKELTEKVKEQIEKDGEADLRGINLKIGGEGKFKQYDQIMVSAANKIGKRFGAKVGQTKIKGVDTDTAHSLEITPEMVKSVMEEGQPLFREERTPQDTVELADVATGLAETTEELHGAVAGSFRELFQLIHQSKEAPRPPDFVVKESKVDGEAYLFGMSLRPMFEYYTQQAKLGKKITAHRVLDDIAVIGKGTLYPALAAKIRKHIADLQITFVDGPYQFNGKTYTAPGKYVPKVFVGGISGRTQIGASPQQIFVRTDGMEDGNTNPGWILIHEMLHAVTYDYMDTHPNDPDVKELGKLLQKTRALIPAVIEQLDQLEGVTGYDPKAQYDYSSEEAEGDAYGLGNVLEFVAEAHSNPGFMRILAIAGKFDKTGIIAKIQLTIDKVAAFVNKILGNTPQEGKLLHEVWNVTERVMAKQENYLNGMMQIAAQHEGETVYLNASEKAQKREAEVAFATLKEVRKSRAVSFTEGKLRVYWNQLLTTFSPESLGPEAKQAGAVLARAVAQQAQSDSMHHGRSEVRRAFWEKSGELAQKFIRAYEKGGTFTDEFLKKVDAAYRAWGQRIYEAEQAAGIEYEAQDNYLYHLFEDSDGVRSYLTRKYGLKWGKPNFVRDRSFDTYQEAIAAGFKPKYTNPEDIMLARQHASDVALARVWALQEMERHGLAREVKKGEKGAPEGFFVAPRRSPNGKSYWVHERAQPIVHNLFDSKSLWSAGGFTGDAFRGLMYLKNVSVPVLLGLSLFHFLHVLTIDNTTGAVRATKELLAGKVNPVKWFAEVGKAFLYKGIVSSPRYGGRILRIVKGHVPEAEITKADRAALVAMAEGGFIPEMSPQYRTGARHSFMSAVRQHSWKAPFKLPFAIIDAMQAPMFEYWIPSLKVASYIKDCQTALKTDPELLTNDMKRMIAFRKIAKSIDNRYGEMAYNTLFWNRWVKDIGVASTLSLGWNLGFLREYGGAVGDLSKAAIHPTKTKVSEGDLDRPLFVLIQSVQSLAYGGLMTYLLGGDEPDEWRDYFYPKNGEKNPDGSDQRVSTMFYTREFAAIAKHMESEGVVGGLLNTALNKASPAIGMVKEAVTGVNYFGEEIRDPNAPVYQQVAQTLAAQLSSFEPIAVSSIREGQMDNPAKLVAMSVAGFTKAPKYATETATQSAIKHTFAKYYGAKRRPFERAEQSADARKLRDLYGLGKTAEFEKLLEEMKGKYNLTRAEAQRLKTNIRKKEDPYVNMFKRFTWEQQKRLLDDMTPEERAVYLPHSNREHLRRKYQAPEE